MLGVRLGEDAVRVLRQRGGVHLDLAVGTPSFRAADGHHPAVAGLAVALLISLFTGVVVSTAHAVRARQEGLERVFDVLRMPHTEEPTNWSRRYKANLEKLHSGDVMKVAEVVRDLWRRERDRGLSAGEKRMLAKARQILVSELALAEKTD